MRNYSLLGWGQNVQQQQKSSLALHPQLKESEEGEEGEEQEQEEKSKKKQKMMVDICCF